MADLFQTGWFIWGIGLILGFQIFVVLLGEWIYRSDRKRLPVGSVLRVARSAVLPLAITYIFLIKLLELDPDSATVRAVATALWISVIYAVVLLANLLVFEQAPEGTWRNRAPSLFQDLMRLLLVVIGAAVVLSVVWRRDLGGLVAALGIGSVVLGLALQETLGNLMAGIALLFERPFAIGDWIEVNDEQGEVIQINWRSVHIRTLEQNLLVLPNSVLGRETIVNFAKPSIVQTLRLSVTFGLDAPPYKVKNMLLETARQLPQVLKEPGPRVLAAEILEDRIRYEAHVGIRERGRMLEVQDLFFSRLWYNARRAGLSLPLPAAYEIKMTKPSGEADVAARVEVLAHAQGFNLLPAADLRSLADLVSDVVYGEGETLVDQNDISDAVFVIVSGELVAQRQEGQSVRSSLSMGAGDVVGVTSLARQQASDARIGAVTDVCAIRIEHEVVEDLVERFPQLAYAFAELADLRAASLDRIHEPHGGSRVR